MAMTRVILFFSLLAYLVMAGFVMQEIGRENTFENPIDLKEIGDTSPLAGAFTFMLGWTGGYIVLGFQGIPFIAQLIFFIIPFSALIIIGVTMFFPTGNAGA